MLKLFWCRPKLVTMMKNHFYTFTDPTGKSLERKRTRNTKKVLKIGFQFEKKKS